MDFVSLSQFFIALIAVLALIWGLGFILRKLPMKTIQFRKSTHGSLELRDSLFLDPRSKCVVVSWNGKEHLLFVSQQHTCVIDSKVDTGAHVKNTKGDA